ncbi:MAG: 2,4-dihydroxyhept-2-ene-1,7-dioic acid aldolase, partial [Verrucomicrobiota bacterium]|nr:2,4-dihydroxyhept-2-ene-1,7-dioic acid aldolase [Verrucomicrobiota bacterium]
DLSGSVDKLLAFDDGEVVALIATAERGIKQAGKWLGGIVMAGEDIAAKHARGYDLLVAGGDVVFLREGAKALRPG